MIPKNLRHWIPAALVGSMLITSGSLGPTAYAQRVPTGTNQIAFADFEPGSAVPAWDYGYFYSDGNIGGTQARERTYAEPPDGTNHAFRYWFDTTVFAGFNSWWGTGFGMPVPWVNDPAAFNSEDLADYILSFDARVEGLAPGQTTARCVMEFRLGTGPNGDRWALVKALPYRPGSNWTHFVFTLAEGSFISADGQPQTSYQTFLDGLLAGITSVRFNQNHPEPTEFGFDDDNAIYLDNVKLEVVQYDAPPPPPPPRVALNIFEYDQDGKDVWWLWPNYPDTTQGWSANPQKRATYWGDRLSAGNGVGGSTAIKFAMDNSVMTEPLPGWAGGNIVMGGPANYAHLKSGNLRDYRITFDARVEGLAPDQQTTPVTFQIYFNAPDGTLGAPDGNRDMLLRQNVTISGVRSNWQTFTAFLSDGEVNAGSLANFQAHWQRVDEIQFQFQILNAHVVSVWGADNDNAFYFDNIKLDFMAIGTPALRAERLGNEVVISWDPPETGTVKLLWGNTIHSVTNEVSGATSPYTNSVSAAPRYFRTMWVPPPPRIYKKLQILMPGETAAPGTPTGKTGSPTPQQVGVPFSVTINAVDDEWYPVRGISNTVRITTDDPSWGGSPMVNPDPALVNGRLVVSDLVFWNQGTFTITVTDLSDPSKGSATSSPTPVNP
jgi:hypothetical protein